MTIELTPEAMEARRKCHNISQIPEEKTSQPSTQYPVKMPFGNEAEVNILPDEGKLREFAASRSVLEEMLKKALQMREQGR